MRLTFDLPEERRRTAGRAAYVLRAGEPGRDRAGPRRLVGDEAAAFVQLDEGESARRRFGLS